MAEGQTAQAIRRGGSSVCRRSRTEAEIARCFLLFEFSAYPFAKARTSQPANIPRPPRGVIAPNHLKLVSAKTYREPLKTITPPRIRVYAARGTGRHPLRTRSTTA